eukprot:236901_1
MGNSNSSEEESDQEFADEALKCYYDQYDDNESPINESINTKNNSLNLYCRAELLVDGYIRIHIIDKYKLYIMKELITFIKKWMPQNVSVFVRFRPINQREKTEWDKHKLGTADQMCPILVDDTELLKYPLNDPNNIGTNIQCIRDTQKFMLPQFEFDSVMIFTNQQTIFKQIGGDIINTTLKGINCTLFAYGQTHSGKRYSLFGPDILEQNNKIEWGIIPRSCEYLFELFNSDSNIKTYSVNVSIFSIYIHNQIKDLLHPAKKGDPPLRVRDGKHGTFIQHLKSSKANTINDILLLINNARANTLISWTKMGSIASRFHVLVRLNIEIEKSNGIRLKSTINFVRLTGSEKIRKIGASGQRLRETAVINPLTTLQNVVRQLTKLSSTKRVHVPYRDSALTHCLKDSLSGNCKTILLCTASPCKFNLEETIRTLRFGSRCKLVMTRAKANVVKKQ